MEPISIEAAWEPGLTWWCTWGANFVRVCEGFRPPAAGNVFTRTTAGVRKPPRDETAGEGTYWAVPRAQLWGFGRGWATAEVSSEGPLSGGDGVAGRVRRVLLICGPVCR